MTRDLERGGAVQVEMSRLAAEQAREILAREIASPSCNDRGEECWICDLNREALEALRRATE